MRLSEKIKFLRQNLYQNFVVDVLKYMKYVIRT